MGVALAATVTEPSGVGLDALVKYLPLVGRAGWFLLLFGVVFVVGWFVVEPVVSRFIRNRNRNNPTIREVVTRWIRVLVVIAALLVGAAGTGYGYVIGDSALVIAAVTLAIGAAGQTVFGSMVSGLVLVADPDVNVGNYVEWSDGQGRIQSITLRVTRVVTPNGELVTIPNTTLTDETITRPYGRSRYRVVEQIGIDYAAGIEDVEDHLLAAAREVETVASEPDPDVYVTAFESDAIRFRVHYWISNPDRADVLGVRTAYATAAKSRLEAAGIEISPASKRELEGRLEVEGTVGTEA